MTVPEAILRTGSGLARASDEHPDQSDSIGQHVQSGEAAQGKGKLVARGIAIAEDESNLSSLFSMLIRSLGYRVEFVADDGNQMVHAVLEEGIHPDLILMDYRMPVMNGLEAAAKIKEARPLIKIIIVTADDSVRGEVTAAGLLFIQKPFSIQALAKILEDVLH